MGHLAQVVWGVEVLQRYMSKYVSTNSNRGQAIYGETYVRFRVQTL